MTQTQTAATANAGAAGVVAPITRDLDQLGTALAGWLAERMPQAEGLRITDLSYPKGAGLSHETILFDAHWREGGQDRTRGMVVRIKPMERGVFRKDYFEEQYRLMELMQHVVPVATPLWIETDASLLGAPFFVMEKVHGRVAVSFPPYSKEGWLFDSTAAQRAVLWEDSVRQLARTQTVPVSQAPFLHEDDSPRGFDQEMQRWVRYVDWVDPNGEAKLLRASYDKLMANMPKNQVEGIVWGDARLGNMMVGDDYKVVAVMDWEQPSLGGALQDVGWWLYTEVMQTEHKGVPTMSGMGSREETIKLWEEVSGKSAADIEWYEAFAALKMDSMTIRMAAAGRIPASVAPKEPGATSAAVIERTFG